MADDTTRTIRIVIDAKPAQQAASDAQRALENLDRQASSMDATLSKLEKSVNGIALTVKANLALAVGELARHFIEMAKGAFDAASKLEDLAEQMGVTATTLQALQFSAAQSGVGVEQLQTGISKLQAKLGEAANGSKPMIDALNQIGVKILDNNGNLKPFETNLTNISKAILAIPDPMRRAAAEVDFFGKSGTKMQTMLADMAGGMDSLAQKAREAGALIEPNITRQLKEMGDRSEVAKIKMQALFVTLGAPLVITFLDDLNKMLATTRREIEAIQRAWAWLSAGGTSPGSINTETADVANRIAQLEQQPQTTMRDSLLNRERARLETLQRQYQSPDKQTKDYTLPAITVVGNADDGRNPTPVGGGETPEEKYARLAQQLENTAAAQAKMTAAARAGEQAFQAQEAAVEAQNKLLEIFKTQLSDTDPRLAKIRDLMLEIAQGKAAEAFNVATTELEKQNVILAKQIELMNDAPEIQAKEIALLKAKNEAQKAGKAVDSDMFEARRAAIEQNEKLKLQQEELKKAQELWTEPLKQALRDIQQIGADAFDQLLESGKISFESLAQTFTKILRRMAAEFLALATIRPVMSVLVNAVGGAGLASQFGLSSGTSFPGFGGGGSLFGGGGGGFGFGGSGNSLFGTAIPSTGSFFGDIGGFFSNAWDRTASFFGGGPALSPAGMAQPVGSSGINLGGIGGSGIGWGQALGAAAGAGLGIYQLINSRSTAGTIGGISSILGAGVSLIPGIGQIAGPAIALLGNLLPGLFGGNTPPTITDQTYGQLRYSSSGWFTNGGAWGPNANSSQTEQSLAGLGGNISNVFALLGGVKDPQKVWGLSAQNRTDQGGNWSSSSTSSFLVDPSGNQQLWRMNESNMWDTGSAQVAWRSIIEGAVGDITDNMRAALTSVGQTMGGASLQAIAQTVQEVKAFDDAIAGLGKTTSTVEQALAQIDQQFAAIYATADKYGFSTSQVDAAKQAERLKYAASFGDSIQRSINDLTDPKINQLADLDKWRKDAIDTNNDILKNVTGALDQINKIEELYALQRAKIVGDSNQQILDATKQAAEKQIATLQDLIRSLTPGGALANVDPRTQLAGLAATYSATRSQAFAGDAAARDRFASDASAYAQFSRSYFAGSSDYNAIRDQIIADAAGLQVSIGGGTTGTTTAAAANDAASAALISNISRLMLTVQSLTDQLRQSEERTARLEALLQRYVANNQAAA